MPLKQNSSIEQWIWFIHVLLCLRLTLMIRQREADAFSQVDVYALFELGLTLFAAALLLGLVFNGKEVLRKFKSVHLWHSFGLYGMGLLSTSWSLMPLYSGFRAFQMLVLTLSLVLAVRGAGRFADAETRVLGFLILTMLLGMGVVIKFYGFTLQLAAWHTNSYSTVGAMLGCYCFGELLGKRKGGLRFYLLGFLGFLGVAIGTSTASNLAAFAGLALAVLICRKYVILLVMMFLGGVLALVAQMNQEVLGVLLGGKDLDSVSRMTGRDVLWLAYWERFLQKPVLGEGFGVTARLGDMYTTNTHNSLLSIACGTGLVGVVTALVGAGCLLWVLFRSLKAGTPGAIGLSAALFAGGVNSMSLAFIGERWSVVTAAFVALLGLVAYRERLPPVKAKVIKKRLKVRWFADPSLVPKRHGFDQSTIPIQKG